MPLLPSSSQLNSISEFFRSGQTLSYPFRRQQLLNLKAGILKYEKRFYEAFAADLKKTPEEAWVTELGFVVAEINEALRELKQQKKTLVVATHDLDRGRALCDLELHLVQGRARGLPEALA